MEAIASYIKYQGNFCEYDMYPPLSDPCPNKRLRYDSDSDSILQLKFEFCLYRISRLIIRLLDGATSHHVIERYSLAKSFTHNLPPKETSKLFQVSVPQIVSNMLSEMGFFKNTSQPERCPMVIDISSYASEIVNSLSSNMGHDQTSTISVEITIGDEYLYDEREALEASFESIAETEQEESYSFVPADDNVIDKLEKVKFIEGDSITSCTICVYDFETGSIVTRMPCAHSFHGDCIIQWLKTNHVCPNCRFELPTPG